MKYHQSKYSLFLFVVSFATLTAQNKQYWNTDTRLIPWRIPLVTDQSDITYEELNEDGTPDIIRTFILDSIPIMWIDDDCDMRYGDTEGDTDNDCLLADLNKDGIFGGPEDLSIDWVDTDDDDIPDIQITIYNGKEDVRYTPDYKSDFIIVIDIENDNIKTFIDWNKLLPLCWEKNGHSNFYQDYHGNTGHPTYDYQQIKNMGVFHHPDGHKMIVARDHGYDTDTQSAYVNARKKKFAPPRFY